MAASRRQAKERRATPRGAIKTSSNGNGNADMSVQQIIPAETVEQLHQLADSVAEIVPPAGPPEALAAGWDELHGQVNGRLDADQIAMMKLVYFCGAVRAFRIVFLEGANGMTQLGNELLRFNEKKE